MQTELDYRQLLKNAQNSLDQAQEFVSAVTSAPQVSVELKARATGITEHLRKVGEEIDYLWDEFKRIQPSR